MAQNKKRKLSRELALSLGSWLMKWLIQIIGATTRVQAVIGSEVVENLLKNRRPVIFCFWHNRIFYSSWYLHKYLFKKGIMLTVLISQSDDGELIARVVKRWGGRLARGSSTRGGREALQILSNALKKQNSSIVTTPDGPKGPVYQFQMGTVLLSQFTQCEIIPICFAADRAWVFRSWDKFIIPKPFSRTVVSFGQPYIVPRKLSEDEKENERLKLEKAMMEQVRQTEALLQGFISQKG